MRLHISHRIPEGCTHDISRFGCPPKAVPKIFLNYYGTADLRAGQKNRKNAGSTGQEHGFLCCQLVCAVWRLRSVKSYRKTHNIHELIEAVLLNLCTLFSYVWGLYYVTHSIRRSRFCKPGMKVRLLVIKTIILGTVHNLFMK